MNIPPWKLRRDCTECGRDWSEAVWHNMQPDERPVCRECWNKLWDAENPK